MLSYASLAYRRCFRGEAIKVASRALRALKGGGGGARQSEVGKNLVEIAMKRNEVAVRAISTKYIYIYIYIYYTHLYMYT